MNNRQKELLVNKLRRHFGNQLKGKTVALWGLAFKPNTDDMREAPARAIIGLLAEEGVNVRAYDPVATEEAQPHLRRRAKYLKLCKTAYEAADGADALVIVTEWKEFRSPDFDRLKEILKSPLIFDGRNIYDPAMLGRFGFTYYAIGRGKALPPE